MAGESILVVDDTVVAQKFMRLLLTHEGYTVRTVGRAEEALDMLPTFRPQLILADVHLPGMGGVELARRIKNDPQTHNIKFLALTAGRNAADHDRLRDAGCDGYVVRPADAQTLSLQVRETLDRPVEPVPVAAPARGDEPFGPGISGEEIEHLRRSFLNEGAERMQQLMESLDAGFDPPQASQLLHSWAGTGGLLGFPEISKLARGCEEMLRGGMYRRADFRDSMEAVLALFSELRAATMVPIPAHVSGSLRAKRIALIGFTPDRADFLCSALEQVKARTRLYSLADCPDAETLGECDLAIVHVRPESLDCVWLQPATAVPAGTTLMLAGDRRDLINLPRDVQSRDVEFLVDTWHPDEVLMRLHLATSRRTIPAPIPAAEPTPKSPDAGPGKPPAGRLSIVIADDDKLITTVVGSTLQNYGMNVQQASNGDDALRIIRETRPQMAVLDINMPGLNGFEVLAAIRQEELPVLVVLLTARHLEDDILRGFQMGADDYMVKPFNPLELIARLKRLQKK